MINLDTVIWAFCLACTSVALVSYFGLGKQKIGANFTFGPQTIHRWSVSRLGGTGIFFSLLCVSLFDYRLSVLMPSFLIATTPVLLAGIVEDVTGNVSVQIRFFFSVLSGLIFCLLSGYSISGIGIEEVKFVFEFSFLSISLTVIAIASLINAMNIIDGLNGLASGCFGMIAFSIAVIAMNVTDIELALNAFVMFAAVAGFFVWNYPSGRVFLGDGGAYLLGFLGACLAVLLPERNPTVSPYFSLLIISYPFYELMRSVVRRAVKTDQRIFKPDDQHLHSIVFKVISRRTSFQTWAQNGIAASISLLFPLGTSIWAILFYSDWVFLVAGCFALVVSYEIFTFVLKKYYL